MSIECCECEKVGLFSWVRELWQESCLEVERTEGRQEGLLYLYYQHYMHVYHRARENSNRII